MVLVITKVGNIIIEIKFLSLSCDIKDLFIAFNSVIKGNACIIINFYRVYLYHLNSFENLFDTYIINAYRF
ncbi:hypothetical protein QF044_002301 [Chryseobacterium sp. W4I1]|nr:hypothetical protein [Chryseobacterium sp. W4I1]